MKRNAVRTASGSGIVTINTERRCSRKTTLTKRDDDRLFDEGALEGLDRPLDERRAVVEGHDLHAGRKARLERGDLRLDAVDDVHGADAVAGHDHAADASSGPFDERRRPKRVADLHLGHLLDEDRHTALAPTTVSSMSARSR